MKASLKQPTQESFDPFQENLPALKKLQRHTKIMDELNAEIERLKYPEKKIIIRVINIFKRALEDETDYVVADSGHTGFLNFIKEKYPELSKDETRHLVYIRMGYTHHQIAGLLGIQLESLKTMRHKLKKKLGITIDLKEQILSWPDCPG